MQFMLMCCFDETRWAALPASQRDEIMHKYNDWVQQQVADGCYLAGGKLAASDAAHTLRKRDGQARLVDGPFAEAKEQIGGYHVIECEDLAAATAIANGIPTLAAGGVVELRPLLRQLGNADTPVGE